MGIEKHLIKVTTVGGDGVAAGSAVQAVPRGKLLAVYLNYHASAPGATTDVTIKSKAGSSGSPPDVTILTESNNATDGWRYPVINAHDNTGAAEADAWVPPIIHGGVVSVDVAQANALTDCVGVTLYIEV